MVGHMIGADGRVMRNMPFVILFNLAWLFFYPLIARAFVRAGHPADASSACRCSSTCTCARISTAARPRSACATSWASSCWDSRWHVLQSGGARLSDLRVLQRRLQPADAHTRGRSSSAVVAAVRPRDHTAGSTTGRHVLSCALPAVLLGISALYTAYTTHQQARLRRSKEEIMRLATLAERERIGRDLHDLLGHTLSVVALKSELARKLIDRDLDAARSEIGEVERVARDALSQVRNAVSGIRSTALSAELLAATALLEAQGVKVKCETENVKLPHDRETALALQPARSGHQHPPPLGRLGRHHSRAQGTDRGGRRSGGRRTRRAHRARQWAQRHARAARQRRRHTVADA